jgi:hypothetical protein
MLDLPSAGQDFVRIRENKLLYVDKTEYLYPIVTEGGNFFLSRPRRFGKSLIIGTLKELLEGNRDLFKGLWIESSDYGFEKRPVIKLSMDCACRTAARLMLSIKYRLKRVAGEFGLEINHDLTPDEILLELVETLYIKENKRVAILIDEYETAIQKGINNITQAEENRIVLHDFYSALKSLADDDKTEVIFITGVAKFAQASIFSGFNNYNDLTLDEKYAAICGFTVDEFRKYFTEYLPDVLECNKSKGIILPDVDLDRFVDKIIEYYDGYSWDGMTRVLNPFSVIQFLEKKVLTDYWFSSATPSFLFDYLKAHHSGFSFPESKFMSASDLKTVNIKNLELVPLLFQTGCLTIDRLEGDDGFLLKRPNKEVSVALDQHLLKNLLAIDQQSINLLKKRILDALENYDSTALSKAFTEILQWNSSTELRASEGQRHLIIHSVLKALSFTVTTQPAVSQGVFDMLLTLGKRKA